MREIVISAAIGAVLGTAWGWLVGERAPGTTKTEAAVSALPNRVCRIREKSAWTMPGLVHGGKAPESEPVPKSDSTVTFKVTETLGFHSSLPDCKKSDAYVELCVEVGGLPWEWEGLKDQLQSAVAKKQSPRVAAALGDALNAQKLREAGVNGFIAALRLQTIGADGLPVCCANIYRRTAHPAHVYGDEGKDYEVVATIHECGVRGRVTPACE